MKTFLDDIVAALNAHNDVLGIARNAYLSKEAERKNFESNLIKAAEGKSHAEKVVNAQATDEWLQFHKELARLEAIFEFQKLKYDVLDKEYQAQYLQAKHDAPLIRRQA